MLVILNINPWIATYAILLTVVLSIVLLIVVGKKRDEKKEKKALAKNNEQIVEEGISGAESAAIAMAMHLYYADGYDESNTITIKHIISRYSPWNSKIYGIQ